MSLRIQICILVILAAVGAQGEVVRAEGLPSAQQKAKIAPVLDFSSVQAANVALHDHDGEISSHYAKSLASFRAAKFLAASGPQGLKFLENAVREHGDSAWIFAVPAFGEAAPARAVPLFLELLPQNLFLKNTRGERMQYGYGSEGGCMPLSNEYGASLARSLGQIGDVQAIPTLREAARAGDESVHCAALEALYRLNAITLEDLFAAGSQLLTVIERIGWENIHDNPRFAILVFNHIIRAFPSQTYEVASSHFWNAQCYSDLKEQQSAIAEYEAVLSFPQFENLIQQATQHKAQLLRQLR